MENNLKFGRPVTFLRVKTTGANPTKDRIIELSVNKKTIDGKSKKITRLINPEIKIPTSVSESTKITAEMLTDKQTFKEIAQGFADFLRDSDFIGFDIKKFDLVFLVEEFHRAGVEFSLIGKNIFDIGEMYRALNTRKFSDAIRQYRGDFAGTEDETEELLEAMLTVHNGEEFNGKKITNDIHDLSTLFVDQKSLDLQGYVVLNGEGRPIFSSGKYVGHLVSEVLLNDRRYYEWIVNMSDYPTDTITIIKKIVEKAKNSLETSEKK